MRKIDWPVIRAAYEAGETNVSELARKFKVGRETIAAHRDEEKWTDSRQIADRVTNNVVDIMSRRALAQPAVEETIAAIAEDLRMQAPLAVKVMKAVDRTLDRFLAGQIHPSDKQNEADVLASVVAASRAGFTLSRDMHGLTSGQPSLGADHKKVDRVEFFVRPKAETA